MYTPLRFMNQIESMVSVQGQPRLKAMANTMVMNAADSFWSKDRGERFIKSRMEWNRLRNSIPSINSYAEDVKRYEDYFTRRTGLIQLDTVDFLFQNNMYLIHKEWSRNKRVYKMDHAIARQLYEMSNPKEIPMKALAFLPSKCFYIDYDGACPFCDNIVGSFVTYDIYENKILWSLTHLCDNSRVLCLCTDCLLNMAPEDMSHLEDVTTELSLGGFSLEHHNVKLEDGSTISITDRGCMRFFINFCLYLYAANNDVEYTERTKQIYKKRSTVRNQLKEVEEFGVGFRNGQRISKSNKRVRYINVGNKVVADVKRGYSSNYRSAHWHHFWINDPDNPGEKKQILKWVEGVFVQGNRDNDDVVIHKVTE